jgi:hypothetical protein
VMVKVFLCLLSVSSLIALAVGEARLEKIDVKILDESKGKVTIKIHPGPPKSVDVDGGFGEKWTKERSFDEFIVSQLNRLSKPRI